MRTHLSGSALPQFIDLTGKTFGRLLVQRRYGTHKARGGHGFPTWECVCICGNTRIILGHALRSGNTQSCGCINVQPTMPINKMRGRYKRTARKNGIPFSISDATFAALLLRHCHYCGAAPTKRLEFSADVHHKEFHANGIDRIDSSKGYEDGNVVPCCAKCNIAKHSMPVSDFLDWVARIYAHSVAGKCA